MFQERGKTDTDTKQHRVSMDEHITTHSRTSFTLWDVGILVPGSLSHDIPQFMRRPIVIPKLTTRKSTARCGEEQSVVLARA